MHLKDERKEKSNGANQQNEISNKRINKVYGWNISL